MTFCEALSCASLFFVVNDYFQTPSGGYRKLFSKATFVIWCYISPEIEMDFVEWIVEGVVSRRWIPSDGDSIRILLTATTYDKQTKWKQGLGNKTRQKTTVFLTFYFS